MTGDWLQFSNLTSYAKIINYLYKKSVMPRVNYSPQNIDPACFEVGNKSWLSAFTLNNSI